VFRTLRPYAAAARAVTDCAGSLPTVDMAQRPVDHDGALRAGWGGYAANSSASCSTLTASTATRETFSEAAQVFIGT